MDFEDVYLTREGYEKLMGELNYLKNTCRREISKEIARARGFGDLRENAEYEAAKDKQAFNEARISELEDKLSRARIIEHENIGCEEVLIGAKVKLKDIKTEEELEYTLVSEVESDYEQGKISVSSPLGKGLMGHKKGETIEIKIPAGVLCYKILKISR
ncbi:MAG: transcription elongation factor GreA [Candidatus Omnitrophota bacterium]